MRSPTTMQIDLDGDWRQYTRLLPKNCKVLGPVKVTREEVTMLNQSRVTMNLGQIALQDLPTAVEMVEVV